MSGFHEIFQNVIANNVECVIPIHPGIGSLESLIAEASKFKLRLAGVPARCITVLPPLSVEEDRLLLFCRLYCFCERFGRSKSFVRGLLFDELGAISSSKVLAHPADIVGRIVHLCFATMTLSESEFQGVVQNCALLQLVEVQRVCRRVRLDNETCTPDLQGYFVKFNDSQDTAQARISMETRDVSPDIVEEEDEIETVDDGETRKSVFLKENDFSVVNHSSLWFDEPTQKIAAVFLKAALNVKQCKEASTVLEDAATLRNLRASINDGQPPETGVLGFYDYLNNPRKCRETQFTRKNWNQISGDVSSLVQALDALYKEHAPVHYAQQRAAIPKSFQLFDTVFSTITVNRNFRTAVHTDKGDFKSGLGVLAVLDGSFEGCHLAVPKLGKAFRLKAGDVLLFDTSLEHGNTEVHCTDSMWHRVSIVCYLRTGLMSQQCASEDRRRLDMALQPRLTGSSGVVNVNLGDKQRAPFYIPSRLYSHFSSAQLSALTFAHERLSKDSGCIIAMGMGLGKTLIGLTLCFSQLAAHPFEDVLIVTPKTIIPHWQQELQKWNTSGNLFIERFITSENSGDFEAATLHFNQQCEGVLGAVKVGHCFVVNPEIVATVLKRCPAFDPELIILDEGHRVSSKQSRLKELLSSFKTKRRLVLTGTPVQNDSEELYRLVEWTNPAVGVTLPRDSFQAIAKPIDEYIGGKDEQLSHAVASQQYLLQWQKGYLFRFTEQALPPLRDLIVVCGSSSKQRELRSHFGLDQCCSALRASEHRVYHLAAHPFCLLGFVSGMWSKSREEKSDDEMNDDTEIEQPLKKKSLDLSHEDYLRSSVQRLHSSVSSVLHESGKMAALVAIVKHSLARGEKTVIFSQYVGVQETITRFLSSMRIPWVQVRGRDAMDTRRKFIDRFRAATVDDVAVLVVSTKVGAFGIDLTCANNVILFDSWWNPQVDAQAVARCYRRNQTKSVCVYRLSSGDDAAIVRAHRRKVTLFNSIIDGVDVLKNAKDGWMHPNKFEDEVDRLEELWYPLSKTPLECDEGNQEFVVNCVLQYRDLVGYDN